MNLNYLKFSIIILIKNKTTKGIADRKPETIAKYQISVKKIQKKKDPIKDIKLILFLNKLIFYIFLTIFIILNIFFLILFPFYIKKSINLQKN